MAMSELGNGLQIAEHYEDALSVREAHFSMLRRLGAAAHNILFVQSNLASTYQILGQLDQALTLRRDVYLGYVKLSGEEHFNTLVAASNYAESLVVRERYAEAKALWLKTISVARRVFGESHGATLKMKSNHARALYMATGATLDDLREAVNTLEETERIARRVLGGAHPVTRMIAPTLRDDARAALRARVESDVSSLREAVEAMAPRNKHTIQPVQPPGGTSPAASFLAKGNESL